MSAGDTTTAADPLESGDFCDLAVRATKGELAFNDEAQVAELVDHPALTEPQRSMVRSAAQDAAVQVASGSYSNDQLVGVVNKICGLHLTPATLTP